MSIQQKGSKLFTFAVIADTHLNQGEQECNSPFEVNKKANARLRYIIDDLNSRSISHVIHLGDVVHPVPSMGELYSDSSARFHEQIKPLKHPMFIIPGNHDVGDKPIKWGPAGTVRQSFLDAWTEYFGAHYFLHWQDDIAFIGINAQVLGSGLDLEKEQASWLETTLEQNKNKRVYIFTHYPPFLLDVEEDEHYDNIGIEGREYLLNLVEKYAVEGLFAGHVHHFWYNRFHQCDCYLLPSTCFTRQDYSEMFRIGPADEQGRDDADKLGYLLVHVHEHGHMVEMVRSYGKQHKTNSSDAASLNRLHSVNAITNMFPVMGFDLRSDWGERLQIPPSGGLEEFDRKWVRNDYGLLALWEMGVRHLRIPAADLVDPERRERLHNLSHLGFRFNFYSFDIPTATHIRLVEENAVLFDSWEICFKSDDLHSLDPEKIQGCRNQGIKIFGSPLRSKADILSSGKKYFHVINHGFTIADVKLEKTIVNETAFQNYFDGIVFRCGLDDSVADIFQMVKSARESYGYEVNIHLRMTADHPGEYQNSDSIVANRLAEAMAYSWATRSAQVFCDTFTDNDRGYFPRTGVLDRRFNPRKGFYIVKALHGLFGQMGLPHDFSRDTESDCRESLSIIASGGSCSISLNPDALPSTTDGHWVEWQQNALTSQVPDFKDGLPRVNVIHN